MKSSIRDEFKENQIIVSYKRDINENLKNEIPNLYLYRYLGKGIDTETSTLVAIYQAMFSYDDIHIGTVYVTPYNIFNKKVDKEIKEKYKNLKQEYSYERYYL